MKNLPRRQSVSMEKGDAQRRLEGHYKFVVEERALEREKRDRCVLQPCSMGISIDGSD